MFEVGDIAYIRISVRGESQRAVVPIKVTERVIRESLEGKIVSYVVRGPTGEDYEIDPEEEELYIRLNDAKAVIVDEAMAGVDKIINKAKMFEQRYFAKDIIAMQPAQSGLGKDVENIITP